MLLRKVFKYVNILFFVSVLILVKKFEYIRNRYYGTAEYNKFEYIRHRYYGTAEYNISEFLSEQLRRSQHLKRICAEKPYRSLSSSRLKNIIIDDEDALTFCPIYKAASTSWSIMLLQMRGKWTKKTDDLKRSLQTNLKIISNSLGPEMSEGSDRFIVVRHPFERLVSCYRDKYENIAKPYYYRAHGERMIREFRKVSKIYDLKKHKLLAEIKDLLKSGKKTINLPGNPYANPLGPTFEEFAKYVTSKKKDDEHWRPYLTHCSVCKMKYDFILKFDNLQEESEMFLQYLNKSSQVSFRWDNPTKGEKTESAIVCNYFSRINLALAKELQKKYENDLLLFEYDATLYLNCSMTTASDS